MTITMFSSREFSQNAGRAKKAAKLGPVLSPIAAAQPTCCSR